MKLAYKITLTLLAVPAMGAAIHQCDRIMTLDFGQDNQVAKLPAWPPRVPRLPGLPVPFPSVQALANDGDESDIGRIVQITAYVVNISRMTGRIFLADQPTQTDLIGALVAECEIGEQVTIGSKLTILGVLEGRKHGRDFGPAVRLSEGKAIP
jgi:hypothetical protein